MNMHRICIVGSPASGKSMLSKKIHEITGIPWIRMSDLADQITSQLDEKSNEQEWNRLLEAALAGGSWITDGYVRRSLEIRLKLADTIIFLDLPLLLCLYRAIRRGVRNLFLAEDTIHPEYKKTFWVRICYLFGLSVYRRIFVFHLIRRKKLITLINQLCSEKRIIWLKK